MADIATKCEKEIVLDAIRELTEAGLITGEGLGLDQATGNPYPVFQDTASIMTLLQKLVDILRKELNDALKSDDVDTMTNALGQVQRSEPRVYFERTEERGAMNVCTKAIEDAIASGSDE